MRSSKTTADGARPMAHLLDVGKARIGWAVVKQATAEEHSLQFGFDVCSVTQSSFKFRQSYTLAGFATL